MLPLAGSLESGPGKAERPSRAECLEKAAKSQSVSPSPRCRHQDGQAFVCQTEAGMYVSEIELKRPEVNQVTPLVTCVLQTEGTVAIEQ